MHIEILVEDSSGQKLLDAVLPKLLGAQGDPHSWRVHPYKGIGHIPKDLKAAADPVKRMLLAQLPRLLQGYGRTPGIDAVVVVLDSDTRHCAAFLAELKALAAGCKPAPHTLFGLAIEEVEAWYLGDVKRQAGAVQRLSARQGRCVEPLRSGQCLRHLGVARGRGVSGWIGGGQKDWLARVRAGQA